MDLWHGSASDFLRLASTGALPKHMLGNFYGLHGAQPSPAEVRSWEYSLAELAQAVRPLAERADVGVSIAADGVTGWNHGAGLTTARGPLGVALEYHLPLSAKRLDAVFTGHDEVGTPGAVVIELKQWSDVDLEDEHAENVLVGGVEHVHPSEQARDYASWLAEYHSAFVDGAMVAASAAYCHNLAPSAAAPLRDSRFRDVLEESPLFVEGQGGDLAGFLGSQVGAGGGVALLDRLFGASFQPSKRVLDRLQAVLDGDERWKLLDEQRLAYNAILAEVRRQRARVGRSTVLVRGGPGTGKTVVAVQLLAAALRLGWKAAHATGGKAFTTALRSAFSGADDLFIWNMNVRNAPTQGLDLLLVDEAHRVRATSDTRWTRAAERGKRSQTEELMNAAKVTVFLLDENQFVRPDEIGSSSVIQEEAKRLGVRVKAVDLATQFRCGGCREYTQWVDWLLGFVDGRPEPWGEKYSVSMVDDPESLERLIAETQAPETARLVAGFCWPWSDATADRHLVPDVEIGNWRRPWNEKAKDKAYPPARHPYTRWAMTPEGEKQIGCIYSAQGFEFTRVGVIWGPDLVWRDGQWAANRSASYDKPVKSRGADMLTLVRNAYRVLLTRGLRGSRLLILDEQTRAHVADALAGMQGPQPPAR